MHYSFLTKHNEHLSNIKIIFNSLALPAGELWGAGTGWTIRFQVKQSFWTVYHLLYPLCNVSAWKKEKSAISQGQSSQFSEFTIHTILGVPSRPHYKAGSLTHTGGKANVFVLKRTYALQAVKGSVLEMVTFSLILSLYNLHKRLN